MSAAVIRSSFVCVALSLLVFAGCGKGGVNGKVTFDGTPVAAGTISFQSKDGSSKMEGAIENGEYMISSAIVPGTYDVKIHVHFVNASDAANFYKQSTDEIKYQFEAQESGEELAEKTVFDVPKELSKGSNKIDFSLP